MNDSVSNYHRRNFNIKLTTSRQINCGLGISQETMTLKHLYALVPIFKVKICNIHDNRLQDPKQYYFILDYGYALMKFTFARVF